MDCPFGNERSYAPYEVESVPAFSNAELMKLIVDRVRNLRNEGMLQEAVALDHVAPIVLTMLQHVVCEARQNKNFDISAYFLQKAKSLISADQEAVASFTSSADSVIRLLWLAFEGNRHDQRFEQSEDICIGNEDYERNSDCVQRDRNEKTQELLWSANSKVYCNRSDADAEPLQELIAVVEDKFCTFHETAISLCGCHFFDDKIVEDEHKNVRIGDGSCSSSAFESSRDLLPSTEKGAVEFLRKQGLIPLTLKCEEGQKAKLHFVRNGVYWKDTKGRRRRVKIGTWFEGTHASLVVTLRFIHAWAYEQTSMEWCQKHFEMNIKMAINWNRRMRDACARALEAQPVKKIGGRRKAVEIGEFMFSRHKFNVGNEQWIFGGICRETNQCFVLQARQRNSREILKAIRENIEAESKIYLKMSYVLSSDGADDADDEFNLRNFTNINKYNLMYTRAAGQFKNIERLLSFVKDRNKRHRGTRSDHLDSYLCELVWRNNYVGNRDPFDVTLETIRVNWPPSTNF